MLVIVWTNKSIYCLSNAFITCSNPELNLFSLKDDFFNKIERKLRKHRRKHFFLCIPSLTVTGCLAQHALKP